MALIKSIDTVSGAAATYWRIISVKIDLMARTVVYVVGGYLTESARLDGKEPLKLEAFTVEIADGAEPESLTRAVLYAHLKAFRSFPGAEAPFEGAEDA